MKFIKIKTRIFYPPKDNLFDLLDQSLPKLREGDVVFITSKILAIHQGRCVKISDKVKKDDLIKKESEYYIPRSQVPNQRAVLAIKRNTLIASAGIDESNGNGYYIYWPKNIDALCASIARFLKKKYKLKKLAVVATDSHTIPMRLGVAGIAIGGYGINPVKDYRNKEDIFGRKMQMTLVDIIDAIASFAVLLMGETKERIPIIILRGANFLEFSSKYKFKTVFIDKKQDIFSPMLKTFKKHRKQDEYLT